MALSKKDKLAIVRQFMIQHPDYRKYGYNRGVIDFLKNQHKITISDSMVSRLVSEVLQEWKEAGDRRFEKSQLIDLHTDVYARNKDDGHVQIRSLQEIGKLQGDYVEKHELSGGLRLEGLYDSLTAEDRERLDKALSQAVKNDMASTRAPRKPKVKKRKKGAK